MLNTVVMSPQCRALFDWRKPSVTPIKTIRVGTSRNIHTGMKMMNIPYHPMYTHRYWNGMLAYTMNNTRQSATRGGTSVRYSRKASPLTKAKRGALPFD